MSLADTEGCLTINVRGSVIDLRVFMENFLWITDKDSRLIPFRLNFEQETVYRKMCELHSKGEMMSINLLKARQMGMTTFIAGVFFSEAMFAPNRNYAVVADTKEHAGNIYEKYRTFYENLNHYDPKLEKEILEYESRGQKHPGDLRPTLDRSARGKVLSTLSGHSSISVLASDKASGRSMTLVGIHASEVAFWRNPNATFTSLNQTVSMNNPDAMVFKETTANGFNDYKTMWDRDAGGRTGCCAVFISWFNHKEYRIPERNMPAKLPIMEEWIYEKLRLHPEITDSQILWYWRQYMSQPSKADMLQEYPFDPMDAFKSSGCSIYDMELIEKRKNEVALIQPTYGRFRAKLEITKDMMTVKVSDMVFDEIPGGAWKIYERPKRGEPYVVICDPTKGFNLDYSAIQVFDNITGRQVACYHSKEDDLDEVGKQLLLAGYYYNGALISSENNTGPKVMELAVKAKYPKIYFEQDSVAENIRNGIKPIPGHNTNRGNRSSMISDSRIQFRNDPECIVDYETLCEMETFQTVEHNGSFREEAANRQVHDDLVLAWVPFNRVRVQQTFENDGVTTGEVKEKTFAELNQEVMELNRKRRDTVETDSFGITW